MYLRYRTTYTVENSLTFQMLQNKIFQSGWGGTTFLAPSLDDLSPWLPLPMDLVITLLFKFANYVKYGLYFPL